MKNILLLGLFWIRLLRWPVWLFFSILVISAAPNSCFAGELPKVLVLNSYHEGFRWTDLIMDGIKFELGDNEESVEYYIEYMDHKRFSSMSGYMADMKMKNVYSKMNFDLIILSDDWSLDYFVNNYSKYFAGVPAIFCGINDFKPSLIDKLDGVTGIAENFSVQSNIELMLEMFPETRTIVSISDSSETSRTNLRRLQRQYPLFLSRINFIEFHDLPLSSLQERLAALPQGSLVLHLSYFSSPDGIVLAPGESVRMVAEASSVPVFGMWDWMFGNGIIGGVLTSGFEQGRAAGVLARRILAGERAGSIPVILESPTSTLFDYRQLKRFGVSPSVLPPDSQVRFEPEGILYKYRDVIWSLALIFAVLVVVICVLGFNIRARRRAERSLRSSREFLDRIIDSLSDPVFVKDHRLRYIHVNQAFCDNVGLRRDEIIGKDDGSVFPPDRAAQFQKNDKRVLSIGGEDVSEDVLVVKDGAQSISVTKKARFADGAGRYFIVAASRDVTEIRKAEIQSKEAFELSEQASKAKSEFLANMSHELRTPLNGAIGMLQLLYGTNLDEEQLKLISIAERSCNNLINILSDILDLSKIESGKLQIVEESFCLMDFISGIAETFQYGPDLKPYVLRFHISDELPEAVVGDQVRLRQILFNLIGNASKFTPEGEVRVSVATIPRVGGLISLWFRVEDTGIGISEDKIEAIFDPFVQADGTSARKFGGVGLGLSIVRRLVCILDGSILLQSLQGHGTDIEVVVPVRPGVPVASPEPDSPEVRVDVLPGKVLLADDDPVGRFAASSMLDRMGVECRAVEDGLQAVEACAAEEFDCILMDMQMPGVDGLEATRMIHAARDAAGLPRIPVIVLTAHAMQGDRERFLASGMDGYLSKPLRLDDLRVALAAMAER